MKIVRFSVLIFLISITIIKVKAQEEDFFKLFKQSNSKYIEDDIPELSPKLFLGELMDYSKHHIHSSPAFSPDGKEMFFSIYINYEKPQRVFHLFQENGKWTKPKELHFSNKFQMGGPVFSTDGKRVYFYGKNPLKGDESRTNSIIWYTEKSGENWSDLKPINYNYDSTKIYVPTHFTKNNELYFTSGINGKLFNIYKGKIKEDKLIQVKKLNPNVNKEGFNNGMAVLNKSGNALIFWRFKRGDDFKSELFVSFKDDAGQFGPAINMGELVNKGGARFAGITPDGKYIFFLSYREKAEKIFWIDSKFIDNLKLKE